MRTKPPDRILSARALLFVPANRPERFAKAHASGAEVIIVDLEDAVPPDQKDEARENVIRWRQSGGEVVVRINGFGTEWFQNDIRSLADAGPTTVMVPKASGADQLSSVLGLLPQGSWLLPVLESAQGILNAEEVCSAPGVVRVAFGNGDLAAELGIDHRDWEALSWARSKVVLASAASGINPPVDGVTTTIGVETVLTADCRRGLSYGFTGKLCIHPNQVRIVQTEFAPSTEQIAWARRIVSISPDGEAVQIDGEMIDRPMVDRARRIAGM